MLMLRTDMNYAKSLLGCHSFSAVQEEEGNILLRNFSVYQSTRPGILQDSNLHQHLY